MFTYNFYNGKLGKEQLIESFADEQSYNYFLTPPEIGDMVQLPSNNDEIDQITYVIKQRLIGTDSIDYFVKAYNWED